MPFSHRENGRSHGRSRGQSVIDQDDHAVAQFHQRPQPESMFPLLQLAPFAGDGLLDHGRRNAEGMDNVVIKKTNIAAGDGAHGQFLVSRHPQFPHQENIQRRLQPPRHFKSDGQTTARQAEHHHFRTVREARQLFRQRPPRLCAILKTKTHKARRKFFNESKAALSHGQYPSSAALPTRAS
jgi:hypothetical protein